MRVRGMTRARTSTPLRDSSGFAPDSPAATASMSIHLVPGAVGRPISCVSVVSECQRIGEKREVVRIREGVPADTEGGSGRARVRGGGPAARGRGGRGAWCAGSTARPGHGPRPPPASPRPPARQGGHRSSRSRAARPGGRPARCSHRVRRARPAPPAGRRRPRGRVRPTGTTTGRRIPPAARGPERGVSARCPPWPAEAPPGRPGRPRPPCSPPASSGRCPRGP